MRIKENKFQKTAKSIFKNIFISAIFLAICGLFFLKVSDLSYADSNISSNDDHYAKGLDFYKAGKYKEAEQEFQKSIEKTKTEKQDYYKKGLIYYNQGKFKLAEQEFKKALNATEKENDQHYKRGLILYNQGRFNEAQKEFEMAISDIKKDKENSVLPAVNDQPDIPVSLPEIKQKSAVKYRIGNGDVLSVKVWQNPDLDDQVIVRPDGLISFALVGEVEASGKTITEFSNTLTQGLREFIKYPQVSVSVNTFGGNRVIVLGQVRSPGVYTLAKGKTILEAVGLAGGFTEDAVTPSIILVKGGLQNPDPKRLDLNKALKLADLSDNLVLESEDIVYVPRRFVKDVNYFLKLFLDPVASGLFIRREYRDF
ncbi:MAG: polysaccharide biosynthesis/export family protein [Candidatus Omnitrophica bacterium]|nr:polysaccharide biosynthesis/export family protein [Candidatus Omnitrophota bacterium]